MPAFCLVSLDSDTSSFIVWSSSTSSSNEFEMTRTFHRHRYLISHLCAATSGRREEHADMLYRPKNITMVGSTDAACTAARLSEWLSQLTKTAFGFLSTSLAWTPVRCSDITVALSCICCHQISFLSTTHTWTPVRCPDITAVLSYICDWQSSKFKVSTWSLLRITCSYAAVSLWSMVRKSMKASRISTAPVL